ncbi:MAG TPA: citrate synthase family protein [Kofleriaceae bacterium]|jgi:citrate synthase|nr:citrate synthase family protein [Kofleriaceae bacterium]
MVDQRRIDDQRWVEAAKAASYLGIAVRSLYAYVSRGQIRSVPGEHGRPRRYAFADLERLRVRRDARAGHGAVAAGALRWGEPVLDSAITAITPRGPAYRGKLAIDLAEADTPFEAVAELLWSGYLPVRVAWPRATLPLAQLVKLVGVDTRTPLDVMPLVVQIAALADPERDDARPDAMIGCGRRLIPLLAAALAPGFAPAAVTRALGAGSVAAIAARAIGLGDDVAPVLDRVLVLLADHELNASSFTARIAASTDAGPYACVSAALATMSGPKHGTAAEEVSRFAAALGSPEAARAQVRALRKRGDIPPGFGHPIYPGGDPRAPPLLEAATRLPHARQARTVLAIVEATTDAAPNVDTGLAALVAALGVPASTSSGLFAVARAAGWLAHALEQRTAGHLLRPRARYTGPPVG